MHSHTNIRPMRLQSFAPKSTASRSSSAQMWQSFAGQDELCQYRICFDKVYHFHHWVIYKKPPACTDLISLLKSCAYKYERAMLVEGSFSPSAEVGGEGEAKHSNITLSLAHVAGWCLHSSPGNECLGRTITCIVMQNARNLSKTSP